MSEQRLESIITQNKSEECVAFFQGMPESQRRRYAPLCLKLLKQMWESDHRNALTAQAAVLATGTLSELRALRFSWVEREADLAFSMLADRRPEWLADRVEQLLKESHYWLYWSLVRRLIRAGLVAKPQRPNYYLAMISGMTERHESDTSIEKLLLDDPELLDDEVWRLFEYEGGGENSLANWDRFGRGEKWHDVLLNFAQSGRLPRARLLSCTLDALERDFNQYRAKWFATFHDGLAPSQAELIEHAPRYLRLLGVSTPSIVAWALNIVKSLVEKNVYDVQALIAGLRPALDSRQKTVPRQALALLSTAAKASPKHAREVVSAAVAALAHEAADVQKAVFDLLDQHPAAVDPDLANTIAGYSTVVAASLRSRLSPWTTGAKSKTTDEKPRAKKSSSRAQATSEFAIPKLSAELKSLFGIDKILSLVEAEKCEVPAATFDGTDIPRLKDSQRLTPIDDLDDLIDVCARVVEDEGQVDDAERAFDGLSRLCDQKPADFAQRVGPLVKRVTQRLGKEAAPFLGIGPADDLCGLIYAWMTGEVIEWETHPVHKDDWVVSTIAGKERGWYKENLRKGLGFLSRRSIALAKRVAVGRAGMLLSAPTHVGGWISPQSLVQRANDWSGEDPDPTDVCLSMLRLAPEGRAEALEQLDKAKSEWQLALRYALGAQGVKFGHSAPLWISAARARSPWTDDERIEKTFADRGPDAGRAASYSVQFGKRGRFINLKVISNPPPPKRIESDCVTVTLHAQRTGREGYSWELGGPGGRTVGSVRWVATIWPLARESFFAGALNTIADNLDWWEAAWQNKTLLEPLLDSGTPLRTMGLMLLTTALAAKEPGEYGLATDIAIRAIEDGRLGSDNLGESLAQFLPTGLIKPGRWQKTLADVARTSPTHGLVVQRALQRAMRGNPAKLPRDYAKLLEILYELSFELDQHIADEDCREFLTQLKSAGKAGKTALSLLALAAKEFSTSSRALMLQVLQQRCTAAAAFSAPSSSSAARRG